MKILYCLERTYNSGGTERIVVSKANWLAAHGYDVVIVTSEQNGRPDFFTLENVRRIDLDIMYSQNVTRNPVRKYIVRRRMMLRHKTLLQQVVDREQPDVVVSTFGNEIGIVPKLKGNFRRVAEIHFCRWYRLLLGRKGIWWLIDRYLTLTDLHALKRYDHFVCLTKTDRNNWRSLNNVSVIPNFRQHSPAKSSPLSAKSVIAVGRLERQKGYNRMIRIWRKVNDIHPDWTLHIYGEGTLHNELMRTIEELHLSDSVFIHPPTKNIEAEYLKNSVFILTSLYEGWPLVLIEAMAAGLPVVSYDCPLGPSEIIQNGYNGFIVKDGDADTFVSSICRIIEDERLRHTMGQNALQSAAAYTADMVMPKWVELFQSARPK